jgi:serine O-acetyltransferase
MNLINPPEFIYGDIGVVIGANSLVTKNIPDNVVVIGNPAKIIKTNIKMSDYV